MPLPPDIVSAFASRPRPAAPQVLRAIVSHDGDRLRELLASRTASDLTAQEIRSEVESRLWMLTPQAFQHFLPAFLRACLEAYPSVSVFASELVGALTEPSRADIVDAFDRAAQMAPGFSLPAGTVDALREQQLAWFDSGSPAALFHARVDDLSTEEGAAVLAFFDAFEQAHGLDFPFGELTSAVDRHWCGYRA